MSSSSPQNPNTNTKSQKTPCLSPNSPQSQSQTLNLTPTQTLTLTPTPTPTPWTPFDSESDPSRHSKLLLKLQSSLQKVRSSEFYRQFVSQLHSPKIQSFLSSFHQIHLIVYGIGKIEFFETPRLQLSLSLLLRRELGDRIISVEVFDPILSATECSVMEELGFPVMRFDELCRREVKVPTLFYMPHCEFQLYENLLSANWGEGLRRMVILGNSFDVYRRYVEAGVLEKRPRVIGVRRFLREVEMEGVEMRGEEEVEYEILISFHHTSWHFFELGDNWDVNNFLE